MKEETVSAAAARAALEKILATDGFRAGRLGAFLRHLVEGALRGAAGELKESVLGMEVFGRAAGYDVRSDSVVRVEAKRLRERLAEYYAGEGAGDRVIIDLPKGGYVPVFRTTGSAPPVPRRRWVWGAVGVAVLGAGGAYRYWKQPAGPRKVLVLPFANLGGDEYFADGLTEEIIDRLGRMTGVEVVSRGVAVGWRGKDPREAGRSLGCSAVVDGSVRRNGERVRIVARLVNPEDGVLLWSESFDREPSDVLAVQEEMARAVAAVLRVKMGAPGRSTHSAEALQEFLRGRYEANRHTFESMKDAVRYLEAAVAKDSEFALAWAKLASAYAVAGYYNLLPDAVTWPKALACAGRALALDSTLADAHAALGMVQGVHDWNWVKAERSMAEALRLGPDSALAHASAAIGYLMPVCRYAEANERFQRAVELDPESVFVYLAWAFTLLSAGAVTEALGKYEALLRLGPQFPDVYSDYGMALGMAGRTAEAEVQYRRSMRLRGRERLDQMGLYFSGQVELARRYADSYGDTDMDRARLWALLGEKERACEFLETARGKRDRQFFLVKVDPRLRGLRGFGRYEAVLRSAGL